MPEGLQGQAAKLQADQRQSALACRAFRWNLPGALCILVLRIFPIVAAVFYAVFQIFTRKLGVAGELPQTTLAWTLAIGTLIATPAAVISWQPVSMGAWTLMISLGIVFGLARIFAIRSFAQAPANLLSPFSYTQVIAATLFGIVCFGAIPELWTMLGIVTIIGAGIYVMRSRS